ncbi:MAG TPA: hypothetical protein VH186_27575 [Chloroflexia bacterium]|nr:hypothetical protein [Chloroflexia bacterium]
MDYDDTLQEPTTNTPETEFDLPERKLSPYRKKQLDYKHQLRPLSSGNRGYRRAVKLLPHLERRSYRRALDAATQAAIRDEDMELISADIVKSTKRWQYKKLVDRKSIPLKEVLERKKELRKARDGKNRRKQTEQ